MEDFNTNSQKGATLMQQALKKYADGDFEGGDKDRELANKFFDLASMEINSESGKISQLYGESRNFGIIYNVIEQNMERLFNTKKGKQFIKEAYNLIKGNDVLLEQFKIYDFFENAYYKDNARDFVNESLSVIRKFDKRKIKENNEKLISLIKEYKLDEYIDIPDDTENLYEAIEYVLLNEKKLDNIDKFMNATNVIVEHVKSDENKKLNESHQNTFEDFKNKVEKQENEINETINEDEKRLIEMFTDPKTNKKAIFENYKSDTLAKIKGAMQISEEKDMESWNKVYESVNSKVYSNKMTQNIINCAEMLEICSTIEE